MNAIPRPGILAAILFMFGATGAQSAPSTNDYCSCLESESHVSSGRYDGGLAASLMVPSGVVRSRKPRVDDGWNVEEMQWVSGRTLITYGSYPADERFSDAAIRGWYDHPSKNQCVLNVKGRRALVEVAHRRKREGITVLFETIPLPAHDFVLRIFAGDRKTVCSLGAATIWSAMVDADTWQGLTVLSVSRDSKSFRYRNKVGIVKRAKVGDTITPYWGKVKSISDTSVKVTELEEDGAGGWEEVERVLMVGKGAPTGK